MKPIIWQAEVGQGPLVACAIHDGHAVGAEVRELLKLDDAARRYEEDPYTGAWTAIAPTRVVGTCSRFEVDLNRPREQAVYLTPADAWGLDVWKSPPPAEVVGGSLAAYDAFYANLRRVLQDLIDRHGRIVVFDLHSYNHIRGGTGGRPDDPQANPEINLGTGTMDRSRWAPIVDRWLAEMQGFDYLGRALDVRENVRFRGGNLVTWIHQTFPCDVCGLAIEVKKFFMDEWTGKLDERQHRAIGAALQRAATGVLDELEKLGRVQRV